MKREYPESPIVGVGGIIFSNTSVLLVKRDKEPGKGLWSLPGGAVELGETLTDALAREIAEEYFEAGAVASRLLSDVGLA